MTIGEIITQIASPIIAASAGFLAGRKRNNLDNQAIDIQNAGANLDLYQKMLDDVEERFNKRVLELKQELQDCKDQYLKK